MQWKWKCDTTSQYIHTLFNEEMFTIACFLLIDGSPGKTMSQSKSKVQAGNFSDKIVKCKQHVKFNLDQEGEN